MLYHADAKDDILTTLRGYFLLTAADLALYPGGSPVHIKAEHSAANTSRTVFELFRAAAAQFLTNIGALKLDQVLEVFEFPPIDGEEEKRRV